MNIRISVIVATYNRKNSLDICLGSLGDQTYPKSDFEVIVVNDGTTQELNSLIEKYAQKYSLSYFRQIHSGPAVARNLGIKMAKGQIIAFIDDDVICQRDWLEKGATYFSNDSACAAVEGKVMSSACHNSPFSDHVENLRGGFYKTCNMLYRKEVLDELGGFDERFPGAFREDSDLAFRVIEAGRKIIFAPDAVVTHTAGPTDLRTPFRLVKRHYFDALLFKKHPKLYREKIEVFYLGSVKISRPRQFLYGVYCLALLSAIILFALGQRPLAMLAASFFLAAYLVVISEANRLWEIKKADFFHLFLSIPVYAAVPPVYFYYLLKGLARAKARFSSD